MENPVLNQFAERLLDLGKRNRLLNFTASRLSSLQLLAPAPEVIFAKLPSSSQGMKAIDVDKVYTGLVLPSEEVIRSTYEKKANSAQVLFYNKETAPSKVLKALSRKASSALQEQGTSILYLAFGFVRYIDVRDHGSYKAPLLLLPVSLEGGTPLKGYILKAASDDVELNPTFAYYCQSFAKLTLPDYDNSDLPSYLAKVAPLFEALNWSLDSQEVELSTFSFEKMSMYLDLENNQETILANPLIDQILGLANPTPSAFDPSEEPASLDEIAFHNVFSADASQLSAIHYAKEGKSFVLQGPPGTGKSQSITNIIAEALHDHKKVLFVSEKLAALNVVYNNLKKAGLTDFALELHSDKSDKQAIFSELSRSLYSYKTSLSEEEKDDIDELIAARKELDFYAKAIHDPTSFGGKSVYELISAYEELSPVVSLSYVNDGIANKDLAYYKDAATLLERYEDYSKYFGYDYRKAELKELVLPLLSYEEKTHLLFAYSDALGALKSLDALLKKEEGFFLKALPNVEAAEAFSAFALKSQDTPYDDTSFYSETERKALVASLKKAQQKATELLSEEQKLAPLVTPKESLEALASLLGEEQKGYGVFALLSKTRKANTERLKNSVPGGKSREEKVAYLKDYLQEQKDLTAFHDEMTLSLAVFSSSDQGIKTDFATILETLNDYDIAQKKGVFAGDFSPNASSEDFHHALASLALDFTPILARLQQDFSVLNPLYPKRTSPLEQLDFALLEADFNLAFNHGEDFESWGEALQLLKKIQEQGLILFLDQYLDKALPLKAMAQSYQKDFLMQEVYYQLSLSASLKSFSRLERESLIAKFKSLDEIQYRISRNQIAERLSEGRPSALTSNSDPNVGKILREHEKKRKVMPTRYLLQNYFSTVSAIKPLFLMSPLSVSTYLSPSAQFDLVVFDEASQIFPEDALGAIYRGKQAIIVGDEHQLPPTSFFMANDVEEENDEDYDENDSDYESILELAAGSLPSKRLLWHYRSKNEALIAFSNNEIYDSTLVSFPNAVRKAEDGVHFHFCPAGRYLRKSRTNPVEAATVTALLFSLAKAYPERSIGIVAFSQAQQEAIEDAIDNAREKDHSLETTFFARKDEPYFVKNLETVQGDERDVIILSIGYAPDEEGHFYQRFGPLNVVGGERRLNVAITRAKYALELVSSIKAKDIDESKTTSHGVLLLQKYLRFAENHGEIAIPSTNANEALLKDISAFIEKQGYETLLNYGESLGKIEIAVREKGAKDFLLAIETDGSLFQSARTARDRDELRPAILSLMGWNYLRVYSEAWFKSRPQEEALILEALRKAKEKKAQAPSEDLPSEEAPAKEEATKAPTVQNDIAPSKTPAKAVSFMPYEIDTSIVNPYVVFKRGVLFRHVEMIALTNKILSLITLEGPIDGAMLYRRLAHLKESEPYPEGANDSITTLVEHLHLPGVKEDEGFFYRDSKSHPFAFRVYDPAEGEPRNPEDISPKELADGISALLKKNGPMKKEDLFQELARLLHYTSSDQKERYYFEDTIVKDDTLSIDLNDNVIYTPNEK